MKLRQPRFLRRDAAEAASELRREPEADGVVPLAQREVAPREWNLWVLERIAAETEGSDPVQDEERTLLLLSLRQFANASGELPPEFDPLVRDAFGTALGSPPAHIG